MTTSAVIFDLDGTLVETAPDLHAVLGEVLEEEGVPAPSLEGVRHMVGDGARALVARALSAAGELADEKRLDRLFDRFLELYIANPARLSHAYPGVEEVLSHLRSGGQRLGVCTNKPQRPSELLLEAVGLAHHFGCVLGGDVLGARKPDPVHLATVIERLGGSRERAIMVGDSANDVAAARALGIPCIVMSFGYSGVPARELGAELVIDRFAELLPALEGLRAAA